MCVPFWLGTTSNRKEGHALVLAGRVSLQSPPLYYGYSIHTSVIAVDRKIQRVVAKPTRQCSLPDDEFRDWQLQNVISPQVGLLGCPYSFFVVLSEFAGSRISVIFVSSSFFVSYWRGFKNYTLNSVHSASEIWNQVWFSTNESYP